MSKVCKVDGCEKSFHGKGYCNKHLYMFQRYGDPLKPSANDPNKFVEHKYCYEFYTTDIQGFPNGSFFVSKEDFDFVSKYKWSAISRGYITRDVKGGLRRKSYLHREIMNPPDGYVVDHVNGDPRDNRRENLRIGTQHQNSMNTTKPKGIYSSKYLGVSKTKNGTYQAYIKLNYQKINIGHFQDEEEAAWMRDQYALSLHGDYATLNFDYR